MNEKYLILERNIQNDLQAIDRIYADLQRELPLADTDSEEKLIVVAYRLHNLYNAFENIFRNIAQVFENEIEDSSRWHTQLLERMQLDLMPIRPNVIDANAHDKLDELRRFRHLFRSAYTVNLDVDRLRLVVKKTLALRDVYPEQMRRFLEFVRTLQS